MKSALPKVLHDICGKPMLSYVTSACRVAGIDRLIVVVGHEQEKVRAALASEDITWVEQAEQLGTGHAVMVCREALSGFTGSVLVIAGDMPLVRRATLAGLYEARESNGDALAIATTVLDDPTGYGRIVRNEMGELEAIVEHNDCTPQQREIREVNPSYYCFDGAALFEALDQVKPSGKKKEYYITDAIHLLRESGKGVSAPIQVPAEDAMGINSRMDLSLVTRVMQDRIQRSILEDGVTIVDPDNTWIEADVTVGQDTVIHPFSHIGASARIGENCTIGPFGLVPRGEEVAAGETVSGNAPAGAI